MSNSYRFVKLLKNHIYPTYQLHAFMANDKTNPHDGLRLAALTTMQWLNNRLGDASPLEWRNMPSPEKYMTASDADLPSIYINQGHVINIVSLMDKGTWTLQITEPDLGSDPGNPNQARPPVPGRIIETNIAFQIVGKQLECGFKTVISDPEGTTPEAEVYRTTVVKLLMENPAFGLTQIIDIPMKLLRLSNSSQVKTMLYVTHHADNQLPTVVFTQIVKEEKALPEAPDLSKLRFGRIPPLPVLEPKSLNLPKDLPKPIAADSNKTVVTDPPYDLNRFVYYTFSHCRTYLLEQKAEKHFSSQSGICFKPGDIIVLYPTSLGGGERLIPYRPTDDPWDENIQAVEKGIKDSLKARSVNFGHIMFLSGVREQLLRLSDELMENAEAAGAHFKSEIQQLNAFWQNEIAQKDQEMELLSSQLQRQKEYAARLEDEKSKIREEFSRERDKLQAEIETHQETIQFLRRRYEQPRTYDGIQDWVEKHFAGRLILHPKAIARMLTRTCQCASVDLVCDALDYLATDYWEQRFHQLPKDVALTRCGEKYGRPFEVKPTGQVTIDYTPGDYKIKYFTNAQGKEIDSDLDYHLRVGNDPENLLRIYFLHDNAKQIIVIGSLPDHLRAVKVQ